MSTPSKAGLFYTGDDSGNPHLSGIPAADLSYEDVRRHAWIAKGDKRPVSPADLSDKDIEAFREELAATSIYRKTPPSGTAPAAPAQAEPAP